MPPNTHLPKLNTPDARLVGEPYIQRVSAIHDMPRDYVRSYDLSKLFSILWHRKWTVILTMLSILGLVTLLTLMATPIYRASSIIEISRNSLDAISFDDTQALRFDDKEFYKTQYGLLRSPTLVKKVIQKLNLNQTSILDSKTDDLKADEQLLIKVFSSKVTISPLQGSGLVTVSYDSPDPRLASKVTNEYVSQFITLNVAKKRGKSSFTRDFLITRVSEVERKLEDSESLLDQYASSNNIIKYDESETVKLVALKKLEEMLAIAEKESVDANGARRQARGRSATVSVANDVVIQELKKQKIKLLADYKEMLQTFKPTYPQMQTLQKRITKLSQEIESEKKAILTNIVDLTNKSYVTSNEKVNKLRSKVKQLKVGLMNAQGKSLEYNKIKRKVSTYQALYSTLLKRLNEVTVEGNAVVNNISVVSAADIPYFPVSPKKKLNIVLGALLGLIAGLGLAFLKEFRGPKIRDEKDIEQLSNLPLLGRVPSIKPEKGKDSSLLLYSKQGSPLLEAISSLRTNLIYGVGNSSPQTILMTSPFEGEGKTSTAINLACTYVLAGKKVLLIDANLRKPGIAKRIFKGLKNVGLSDYLAGKANANEVITHSRIPRLSIITSGFIPANPVELLSSEKMTALLDFVKQEFDFVIIDGCPIQDLSDSIILSKLVDATIMTVKMDKTLITDLINSLNRLENVHSNMLGIVVMNAVQKNSSYSQQLNKDVKRIA